MTEQSSAASSRAPKIGGALAVAASVALALIPITGNSEGKRNHAYLDVAGVPTICFGHTAGVKLGMVATDAQCHVWLQQDLTLHAKAVLAATPVLAGHPGPLKAATDFAYNAGDGAYRSSTMARRFAVNDFTGGCIAFLAWDKAHVNGKIVVVPGLLKRRQSEMAMCLAV